MSMHHATTRALRKISPNGREYAICRINRQRIDLTGEQVAAGLGHRALGFYGTLPAYSAGRHHFPASSLGVAGPRGTLPA